MSETEETSFWNYFEKLPRDGYFKKALCTLCNNVYNYSSTSNNLKRHLEVKHGEEFGICAEKKGRSSNSTRKSDNEKLGRSVVWGFFTKVEGTRVASCNICERTYSYKTTITNLKKHLEVQHAQEYAEMLKSILDGDCEEIYLDFNDDSNDSAKELCKTELWSHFEKETGGRARCMTCGSSLPCSVKEMNQHVQDCNVSLDSEKKARAVSGDRDVVLKSDNDETNFASVYINDLTESRRKYKNTRKIKTKRKRLHSSSSDESVPKLKKTDDLDNFITYIAGLLKNLPKPVCTKLQMDIVNLILNAELQQNSDHSGVPVSLNSSGFVVVPTDSSSNVIDKKTRAPVQTSVGTDTIIESNVIEEYSIVGQDSEMEAK